jgi:hypothetical protein
LIATADKLGHAGPERLEHRHRHPKIHFGVDIKSGKTRRSNAHHRERVAVDEKRLPYRVEILTKASPPQSVADNDDG